MTMFLTADQHFYHDPIIEMCNRPYKTGHQMHKDIIRKYNEKVKNSDTAYFVGDVSFSKDKEPIRRIIEKLNGHKILILGNHDQLNPFDYVDIGFDSVHTSLIIDTFVGEFILVHDPAISQIDRSKRFLCGHIHDLFKMQKNCINIGVDVWDFYPVSLEELIAFIQQMKNEGLYWKHNEKKNEKYSLDDCL